MGKVSWAFWLSCLGLRPKGCFVGIRRLIKEAGKVKCEQDKGRSVKWPM